MNCDFYYSLFLIFDFSSYSIIFLSFLKDIDWILHYFCKYHMFFKFEGESWCLLEWKWFWICEKCQEARSDLWAKRWSKKIQTFIWKSRSVISLLMALLVLFGLLCTIGTLLMDTSSGHRRSSSLKIGNSGIVMLMWKPLAAKSSHEETTCYVICGIIWYGWQVSYIEIVLDLMTDFWYFGWYVMWCNFTVFLTIIILQGDSSFACNEQLTFCRGKNIFMDFTFNGRSVYER